MTTTAPTVVRERPGRARRGRGGQSGSVTWMVLPALVMFIAFAVVPLFGVLFLSFTRWDGIGSIHAAGLDSWRAVLSDPGLPHALFVTFLIMILSWAVQTPLSILLGVFLASREKYRAALAVAFFVPVLLSSAAIAVSLQSLAGSQLRPRRRARTSPLLSQDWLGKNTLAVGVVIFIVSWQFIPFHSLIYQGAVRQIPKTMYEASARSRGPDGSGSSSASHCRRSSTRSSPRRP